MKKTLLAVLCLIILCTSISACTPVQQADNEKTVIATTYAAYDWTKAVIKNTDGVEVKYLVDSNVDLHSYQPSADDIAAFKTADLVICVGGESEEWIEDIGIDPEHILTLMEFVNKKEEEHKDGMQEEEPEEEVEEEGPEYDEHIWLSLNNAIECVQAISAALVQLEPKNDSYYTANTDNYVSMLDNLNKKYINVLSESQNKTLIFADRFPFRYLLDDYGLDYYAAFIGCSAETEASFETIAFLAEKINELKLKNVCVIGDDTSIAQTVINTSANKDAGIIRLDSMQSISNKEADNVSYLGIMETNLPALAEALEVRQ